MSITIRDIAKEANVSHTTVSLVLNSRAGRSIPVPTRQRVIEAAASLGYRPNQFARALASGRTNVIEVRGIRLYDPHYVHILMSLQAILAEEGYQVITSPYPAPGAPVRKAAVKWPIDGIIAIDGLEDAGQSDDHANLRRTPTVCLGAYVSESVDSVTVDLADGVAAAMKHLYETGYRDIVYLADILDQGTSGRREIAYEAARREMGMEAVWILCGVATRSAARNSVDDYIKRNGAPDAILCRSDSLAIGALRALHDHGVGVPARTALIGCNGIEESKFNNPQISTIEIPVDDMCREAWRLLSHRILEPSLPRQVITCSAKLVVRGSSNRRVPPSEEQRR